VNRYERFCGGAFLKKEATMVRHFRRQASHIWALCVVGFGLVINGGLLGAAEPAAPLQPGQYRAIIEMKGQVFPSFIIAMANIKLPETTKAQLAEMHFFGDLKGVIGLVVVSPTDNAKLILHVTCKAIMDPSDIECILPKAGATYWVYPQVAYHYDDLGSIKQAKPENITFTVSLDGGEVHKWIETVRVRSINDCVYLAPLNHNTKECYCPWMFAAYVNEDHPWIDMLLKEALDHGVVKQFSGYQTNDPKEVYLQVYAIWNVLQRRGLKYSSITTVAPEMPGVFSQHVRFLDESVEYAQANCVDGSVVFASPSGKSAWTPSLSKSQII
jgi:hypothetical protein